MIISRYLKLISAFLLLISQQVLSQTKDIEIAQKSVQCLTDVMVYDITSPVVASRNYAYSLIAFYEAVKFSNTSFKSYAGQLNGLQPLPKITGGVVYDWPITGTTAFYKTGYAFVFSKDRFQQSWEPVAAAIKKKNVSP